MKYNLISPFILGCIVGALITNSAIPIKEAEIIDGYWCVTAEFDSYKAFNKARQQSDSFTNVYIEYSNNKLLVHSGCK